MCHIICPAAFGYWTEIELPAQLASAHGMMQVPSCPSPQSSKMFWARPARVSSGALVVSFPALPEMLVIEPENFCVQSYFDVVPP